MAEFLEVIRHEGNKWILYTHDGKKKLGEFETKEGALKRERQIQFYKHHEAKGGEVPYPNEHACRIRSPGDFEKDSFRRIQSGETGGPGPRDGKKLSIIIGRLKGKTSTTTQTFRYPIDTWTETQAKAHCAEQGGTFEPAVPNKESISLRDRIQIALDETEISESVTFKAQVQALLRSADGVAKNKGIPNKVKASIQNLRTLLHQTWGDIDAGTDDAGETGDAESIDVIDMNGTLEVLLNESGGALLANPQQFVENGSMVGQN